MANFCELDDNNIVVRIIRIANDSMLDENGNESETLGIQECVRLTGGGRWVQTSINTHQGVHFNWESNKPDGGTPFRGNFGNVGYAYYEDKDVFAPAERPIDVPEWFELNVGGYWSCPIGLNPETGLPLTPEQWDFLEVAYSMPQFTPNPDWEPGPITG